MIGKVEGKDVGKVQKIDTLEQRYTKLGTIYPFRHAIKTDEG